MATTRQEGPQTDTYTYNAVGDRLTKNATSYTYDAADQMLTAGGVTYGYDNNGNQSSRGSDTFTYDHENRLTQTVIAGATSTSTYNGDGLRMSHTVSGQTTNYTWDPASKLPVVLQDGTAAYIYGLDLISATDGSGNQTYMTYDGLGSTTDLTDGAANVVATYAYDVFGSIRSQGGSSPNYWLFTGEQRDSDSTLYFLRARYYDPAVGRFLSTDPKPAINLYAYVGNNPVGFSDPTGETALPAAVSAFLEITKRRLEIGIAGLQHAFDLAEKYGIEITDEARKSLDIGKAYLDTITEFMAAAMGSPCGGFALGLAGAAAMSAGPVGLGVAVSVDLVTMLISETEAYKTRDPVAGGKLGLDAATFNLKGFGLAFENAGMTNAGAGFGWVGLSVSAAQCANDILGRL